jgi:DHA1 family tetracycline resistance protein-like MFS transporter
MRAKLQSPLFIIFLTIFFDLLGFGVIIPILPSLFADPSSQFFMLGNGVSVQIGYILTGLLTGLFFFAQFFAAPVLGELSDQHGRKKIIFLSLVGTLVAQILMGTSIAIKSTALLFATRFAHGFMTAIIPVAQATIADITPPAERAKNFGLIGAAFGLGFIVGPFLGGILSDHTLSPYFGASTPFWFASILAIINLVFVARFFKETHSTRTKRPIEWTRGIKNIMRAYNMPTLRPLFLTSFFYNAGFTFYTTFAGIFLFDHFGFTGKSIGLYFAYVGLWIAITQGFLIRKATRRWNERTILEKSMLGTAIFAVLQTLTGAPWELFLITPFFSISNGFTMSNLSGLLSRSAPKEAQGEIMGIASSMNAIASMIPPVLSGFVAAALSPSSPLIVAGLLCAIAWAIFVTTKTSAK